MVEVLFLETMLVEKLVKCGVLQTIGEVEMRFLEDPTRHPNNTSGESYVVDQNGDGVINSDDYVKIGQATPDFTGD